MMGCPRETHVGVSLGLCRIGINGISIGINGFGVMGKLGSRQTKEKGGVDPKGKQNDAGFGHPDSDVQTNKQLETKPSWLWRSSHSVGVW
jgi:hypothetical protein